MYALNLFISGFKKLFTVPYFSILIEISFGRAIPAATCIDLKSPIGIAQPEQQREIEICNNFIDLIDSLKPKPD